MTATAKASEPERATDSAGSVSVDPAQTATGTGRAGVVSAHNSRTESGPARDSGLGREPAWREPHPEDPERHCSALAPRRRRSVPERPPASGRSRHHRPAWSDVSGSVQTGGVRRGHTRRQPTCRGVTGIRTMCSTTRYRRTESRPPVTGAQRASPTSPSRGSVPSEGHPPHPGCQ